MRPFRSYIVIASLCLPAMLLHAQHKHAAPAPSPATIQATADKQKIVIGEPIHVHLQVTVPDNIPFAWPALDSMPHFEYIDKGKIDTIVRPGERSYEQYLTVTSFDSGTWAIPRLPFLVASKKTFSDSIRIDVGYTKIDPSKDYHDIKEIIDVPNPFARYIGWIVAAATLISIALVVWFVRKRRQLKESEKIKVTPLLTPFEEAIKALDELATWPLPDAAAMKAFYSRLSDILRTYLHRRMNIYSFAETSEELIRELRRKNLANENELSDALRMGDFVKFAKYQPSLADSQQHYRAVREAVETLEKAQTPPPAPEITQTTQPN